MSQSPEVAEFGDSHTPAFAARVKQELAQWKQIAAARKIVME